MTGRIWLLPTLLLALVLLAPARPAPALRLVPDPHLMDIAETDPETGEIRFNPVVMLALPPAVSSFFFLHEQAHIQLHHRVSRVVAVAHRLELEADCWAARRATPAETAAARGFFARLDRPASTTHPADAQRSAEILRCRP